MHADERAAVVAIWKGPPLIKGQTEGGDMGAESVVRFDRFSDEIRPLAFLARILDLAKIGKWPTVKSSFLNAREIIRDEIVAEQIALVDDRPKGFGLRFPIHSDGVAQSIGENSHTAAVGIDLQNPRTTLIFFPSIFFIDVRRGANGDVNLLAPRIGDQIAGIVAVRGKVENFFTFPFDFSLPGAVGLTNDAVRIAHIEPVSKGHHAVRHIQAGEKCLT